MISTPAAFASGSSLATIALLPRTGAVGHWGFCAAPLVERSIGCCFCACAHATKEMKATTSAAQMRRRSVGALMGGLPERFFMGK